MVRRRAAGGCSWYVYFILRLEGVLSSDDLLLGPPGTGKTTTIAAALERWDTDGYPTWVIAQSNVGVKNIARTLIKYAVDFKLIVSKEFYVEWSVSMSAT